MNADNLLEEFEPFVADVIVWEVRELGWTAVVRLTVVFLVRDEERRTATT